jgi:hypothetical protein
MGQHHRFVPSSVTTPLLIECADVQIDALGIYDTAGGGLESIIINQRHVSIAQVNAALAILCPEDAGNWSDDLDSATLTDLLSEDAENAACDWADWQRDMNMEPM